MTKIKKMKSHCNNCGTQTNHYVRASYIHQESDYVEELGYELFSKDDWKIIQCMGCDHIGAYREYYFSEDPGSTITIYPSAISRRKPEWLLDFRSSLILNETLIAILDELYIALQNNIPFLATSACRTIVDFIMGEKLSNNEINFSQKIKLMISEGFISKSESELIATVVEAGHASIHRGWSPKERNQLETLVGIIENLIERLYILPEYEAHLKAGIPPRKSKSVKK